MPLEESLRDEFAVETEEHLDAIEAGLNPPSEARPAIDALFRAFHSLKGMSDAVGAAGMKALAHRAEDALGLARQGKLSVARAAPALLQAGDALRLARAALLERGEDLPPPPAVLAALSALLDPGQAPPEAPSPRAAAPPSQAAPAPDVQDPLLATLFSMLVEAAPALAAGQPQPELVEACAEMGLHRLAAQLAAPPGLPRTGRLWRMILLLAEQVGEPMPALPQAFGDAAPLLAALAAAAHDPALAGDAADAAYALGEAEAELALRRLQDLCARLPDADATAALARHEAAWAVALRHGSLAALRGLGLDSLASDDRLPADFAAALSPGATRRALAALAAGLLLYRVRAITGGAPEDEAALEFWLRGAGEVLGSILVPQSNPPQLDLLLASATAEEGLRAALALADPDKRHVLSLAPATAITLAAVPMAPVAPSLRVRQDVVDNIITLAAEMRAAAAALSDALRDPSMAAAMEAIAATEHRLGGSAARQLAAATGQINALRNRMSGADSRLGLSMRQLDEAVLELRVVPVGALFQRLPRAVRSVADGAGKPVRLELAGEDVRIDRSVIELLADPLLHLVRNAVDHGIEPAGGRGPKPAEAMVRVAAERLPGQVQITVSDDGGGIDAARVRRVAEERGLIAPGTVLSEAATHALLLRAGFSTRTEVTDVSGRGVGLDVVHDAVRRAGGHMSIASRLGEGTSFTLTLPTSAAIQPVLLVEAGGHPYAVPAGRVVSVLGAEEDAGGLPMVALEAALGLPWAPCGGMLVLERPAGRLALQVARVTRRTDLLLRPLHPGLAALPGLSAVGMLGSGEPVLVLEPDGLGG
ncbi:ATP-binding protein [Rhodovarius sp.]|uniref:chemotaxis protein CheA n=1 Tax=Rhodovarius sp. TaxID=2972673 RepID=UPI003341D088